MEITSAQARHVAYLHRYSTATRNKIYRLLDAADRRITADIMQDLADLSHKEIQEFLKGSYSTRRLIRLRDSIRQLSQNARDITREALKESGKQLAGHEVLVAKSFVAAAGVETLGATVTAAQAYAAAMSQPMLGYHVRDFISDLDAKYKKRFFAEIREGFVIGEGVDQIARRIRGTAEQKYKDGLLFTRKRAIETVVRTSLNHISTVAEHLIMVASGVKRCKWVSVLDGRTSKICASRDGKIFDINGPKPPAHPNCRSRRKAYHGDELEGGKRPFVSDGRRVKDIPKAERKGKIGQVSSKTNFSKWFDSQPASFQKDWLGSTRYKLYKKGDYKIDRFVDPKGKELTIEQLRQKDEEIFKELGL